MLIMIKEVKAFEVIDGVLHVCTGASAANDDWLHSSRLIDEGKIEEYEKLANTKTYIVVPDTD
jgi:hypothetical protein